MNVLAVSILALMVSDLALAEATSSSIAGVGHVRGSKNSNQEQVHIQPSAARGGYPFAPFIPSPPLRNPGPVRGAPARPLPPIPKYTGPQGPKTKPRSFKVRRKGLDFGTNRYHRPIGYEALSYFQYSHSPMTPDTHAAHFETSREWYSYISMHASQSIYNNWIFVPSRGLSNGYYNLNNYPFYVYNGFQYRYSSEDKCNYQLVDSYNHRVIKSYWNSACSDGYDLCSLDRDQRNDFIGEFKFFCAETIRSKLDKDVTPSYDKNNYDDGKDCEDSNRDNYCDNY
ncbi:MAG: hypothetical protein AB7I27_17875 [Bacteriovoracaceae bacterium]